MERPRSVASSRVSEEVPTDLTHSLLPSLLLLHGLEAITAGQLCGPSGGPSKPGTSSLIWLDSNRRYELRISNRCGMKKGGGNLEDVSK